MKSRWDDKRAAKFANDPVGLRVYTSRLIGQESDLVLHGGGNTSVKAVMDDVFGDPKDVLWIKGSGWDLATIEKEGFAPVELDLLTRMAALPTLTDSDMVRWQRAAMLDPNAPTPSVEAILHAIIPFKFVDHTHADAVVTITNTPNGMERIGEIYGDRIFIVPYVMPGFVLAQEIYNMTRDMDWEQMEGMILLHHGVFTFADDARGSYERMIQIVTEAEDYIEREAGVEIPEKVDVDVDLDKLARLRLAVSEEADAPMIARMDTGPCAVTFASRPDAVKLANRGPLTPDHVIRTKRVAMPVGDDAVADVAHFAEEYREYFDRNTDGTLTCLDPAPRWAVWPGCGTVSFGRGEKEAGIVADIIEHTVAAILNAEAIEKWETLPEDEIFDVEYWELEQAKLARAGEPPALRGKVAVVTGAASGIGRACVEVLRRDGASVAAWDIDDGIEKIADATGIVCDVTDAAAVARAVNETVLRFGGIDIVISNAGVFPDSSAITDLDDEVWRRSMAVNLDGHRHVFQKTAQYLKLGIDPAIVVVGSKNVQAPGYGAAAYSVAKAGLAQLARVAALELAPHGVRVNVIHPNDVFDTAIWSDEVLSSRAEHYGMTVDEYKSRNLLGVEIASSDVAELIVAMAGPLFGRTTGAQVSIDGGNDRVI